MKLNEVKDYTLGVLRGSFTNKNVLDGISAEGTDLRYNGKNLGDSYIFNGGELYPEEETIIGEWRDGRPLYRKSEIIGYKGFSPNTWTTLSTIGTECHPVNGTFFDDCRNPYPVAVLNNNGELRMMHHRTGTPIGGNDSNLIVYTYYKDTDAPGSAGSGQAPANFVDGNTYSTEEQIVGQWIDGKPVYRKTVSFTAVYGENYADLNIDNADLVWAVGGFLKTHDLYEGLTWPMMYLHHSSSLHDRYAFSLSWVSKTQLSYFCGNDSNFVNGTGYITVEYTKTTDTPKDMTITPTLATEATDAEVEEVFS